MARIRSLHPGLFTDERYMALSFPARELIKGIWCEADDDGVFDWKPLTLKARIMPADAVNMDDLLTELEDGQFIQHYEHGGHELGAVRNFRTFQRPKKPNSRNLLPDDFRTYVGLTGQRSEPKPVKVAPVPHPLPTSGEKPPQMEEEGRRRKKPPLIPPSDFEAWWGTYPRKTGKGAALKAYTKARAKASAEDLLAGIARYMRQKPDYADWKHPATWLNADCWLDEPDSTPATNGHDERKNHAVADAYADWDDGRPLEEVRANLARANGCTVCGGSGWVRKGGGMARCDHSVTHPHPTERRG